MPLTSLYLKSVLGYPQHYKGLHSICSHPEAVCRIPESICGGHFKGTCAILKVCCIQNAKQRPSKWCLQIAQIASFRMAIGSFKMAFCWHFEAIHTIWKLPTAILKLFVATTSKVSAGILRVSAVFLRSPLLAG